jgi:hypothetical protein
LLSNVKEIKDKGVRENKNDFTSFSVLKNMINRQISKEKVNPNISFNFTTDQNIVAAYTLINSIEPLLVKLYHLLEKVGS